MKRDVAALESQEFDLLIIGAGIHGACAARDAALRGMKVALIDKGDICGATSHNSLKTIHGGIRYLQHLNFKRSLESINEQKYWLETAPHLVKPLPFLMPTYGYGMRGPVAMWFGIRLFELLATGRNKRLIKAAQLPRGKVLSRQQCIDSAPDIETENLTGGAFWYDAQVECADLAVLQIVEHACHAGASAANYVKAQKIDVKDGCVEGVQVRDILSGVDFTIKARLVLNACGPWASSLLENTLGDRDPRLDLPLTKSMNLVVRKPAQKMAVGVQSKCISDSAIGDTRRLYFIVPWKGVSIIGTTHFRFDGTPDKLCIEHDEIADFVRDINHAYPGLELDPVDVLYCHQGLSPADNDLSQKNNNSTPLHHSSVIDHGREDSVEGLLSIVSIKWTTARLLAEQAINLAARRLKVSKPCQTRHAKLPDALRFGESLEQMSDEQLQEFCQQHIANSMTIRLVDMLVRRCDDFVLDKLSIKKIRLIAQTMSDAYKWNEQRQDQEQAALLKMWIPSELKVLLSEQSLFTK